MKTIGIMLSRGIVARNIVRTDVLKLLAEGGNKIVMFVPPNIPDYFRQEVAPYNVILEETNDIEYGRLRKRLFESTLVNLVYSDTSHFMNKFSGRVRMGVHRKQHAPLTYYILDALYRVISKPVWIKRVFRYLELYAFPDREFDHFFSKYQFDLIFCTTIASKRDMALAKAAKRHKVPVAGMTRGWDNLARLLLPVLPDKLIVQNEVMVEMATHMHDIKKEIMTVTGFPQFDLYTDQSIYQSRDAFIQSLGLDPSHKLLFYGSEGQWAPHDEFVIRELIKMVSENQFPFPCSLIIRPHFSDAIEGKFDQFKNIPNVHVDSNFRMTKFFTDMWDPPREEMVYFANELKHLDVMITMASTISLEAALFDKPVVHVDFYLPEEPDQGPYFGRWYTSTHYSGVVATGGVLLAKSLEDLRSKVSNYLLHPEEQRAEREKLALLYCVSKDGKSAQRVADAVLTTAQK